MRSDAGFSLIEVMVALAIFGLATVALIRLQGVSLASAATLSDRQYAAIVARNQALEAMLSAAPPSADQGRERAEGAIVFSTRPLRINMGSRGDRAARLGAL